MAWSPDYIDDGDDATAASVNSKFTTAQTWLEDIGSGGLRRGALNHHHAGQLLVNGSGSTIYGDHGTHTYDGSVIGAPLQYNSFGENGSVDRTLVGSPVAYAGPDAQITFSPNIFVGQANGDHCAAIMVLFNCEVKSSTSGLASPDRNSAVVFCIQFQLDGAGTWWTLERTERFVSMEDLKFEGGANEHLDFDVPIVTMITAADVDHFADSSTDRVSGVRAMVTTSNCDTDTIVILNRFRLTAFGVNAELNP